MNRLVKKTTFVFVAAMLIISAITASTQMVKAQGEQPVSLWGQAANLSRSGGTSRPIVTADSNGRLHAIWWDQFDLARYAIFTDNAGWSLPVSLPTIRLGVDNQPPDEWVLLSDQASQLFLLWTDRIGNLWYAKSLPMGGGFSERQLLGSGMLTWAAQVDPGGIIHLAYIQGGISTTGLTAGVYYTRSANGVNWNAPKALSMSPYFRTMALEEAFISLAVNGRGQILVSWDAPLEKRASLVISNDGGSSFSEPKKLESGDIAQGVAPRHARLLVESAGRILLIWQAGFSCALYQQDLNSTDNGAEWSAARRILETLDSCVQTARYFPLTQGGLALIVRTGATVEALSDPILAVWDRKNWSDSVQIQIPLVEPVTNSLFALGCLDLSVTSDHLLAIGCDYNGDVWSTRSPVNVSEFVPLQQTAWSVSTILSSSSSAPVDLPAAAVDYEGRLHLVYPIFNMDTVLTASTVEITNIASGESLAYARLMSGAWSQPTSILRSPGTGEVLATTSEASQPAILADPVGMIHIAWSGGTTGQIYLSSAFLKDSSFLAGWSTPQELPSVSPVTSSPAMAIDQTGTIYVAYAVSANENRGVYITTSGDHGANWSEPLPVYNLAEQDSTTQARQPVFGKVRLVVDGNDILHAAWVVMGLPPLSQPLGVYYASSDDDGITWSEPLDVGLGQADDPQLILARPDEVHVFYNIYTAGNSELLQQWSLDGGKSWSESVRVAGLRNIADRVSIISDGQGLLYLAALEHTLEDTTALLTFRWDGSTWWGNPERLLLGYDWSDVAGVSSVLMPDGQLLVFYRLLAPGIEGKLIPVLGVVQRKFEYAQTATVVTLPTLTPIPQQTQTITPTPYATPTIAPTSLAEAPDRAPAFGNTSWVQIVAILVGMFIVVVLAIRGLAFRRRRP